MQEQTNPSSAVPPQPPLLSEAPRPAAPAPQRRLGPYALVREAGRGGMAQVYEAVDTRMGRTVAVKVLASAPHLLPAQRDALIARLDREAQALGSLSHPNVVAIFDVGEQDGLHYLVMEYLDGQTLRQRLDDSGAALSSVEAESVLSQVALGLDAVHARGVLHRDIKPSNVMRLPDGRVKLMDFGIARQEGDTTMTQAGMMVGSPAYLAPELIAGDKGTPATDVWSLGVLLYEMLAARPPFAGDTIPAVLYQIAHGDPAPLPNVSPAVTKVLRRALEKDPAKRFPTASALADAFRAAALPAAPAAPPPAARRARAYASVIKEGTAADVAATAVHPTVERSRAGRPPRNLGRNARPAVLALIALLCLGAAGLFAALRPHPSNVAARSGARPAARVTPAPAAPRTAAASPPGPPRTPSTPAASAKKKTPAAPPAPPRRRRPATPSVVVAERPSRPEIRRPRTSEKAAVASPRSQPRRTRRPAVSSLPVAAAGTPSRVSNPRTQRREARRPTPPRTRIAAAAAAAPDARKANEDGRTEAARENRSGTNNGSPASGNAQTELRGHLAGWIGATNARDIEGQMRYYPNRVDNFYTAHGASRRSVQAEKRRVFGAASSVAMSASDPQIRVGVDGKTATMRFRKTYDIAGGRRPRKGEVLQELRWRRTDDGKWQIVSERDLRVLRRR